MLRRLVPFAIAVFVLVTLLVFSKQTPQRVVVTGFIEADDIRAGSRVGGRVAHVRVEEGDTVERGDPLVELEPFDFEQRLAEARHELARAEAELQKRVSGYRAEEIAQAKARLKQAEAELKKLKAGPRPQEIAAARALLELAIAERRQALTSYQRLEALFGQQAVDKESLDEAATKLSVAEKTVEARQAELDLLEEGARAEDVERAEARVEELQQQLALYAGGFRPEEIDEARAVRDAAAAAVKAVETQMQELIIHAPAAALVDAIDLREGDLVTPNAAVVSLIDLSRLRVRAYVPENHLDLQIGQSVTLNVDSFPGRSFSGRVVFVARQAEFTPGNVQTPEDRSRQVYRVKIEITEGADLLRPGMAADVVLKDLLNRE